MSSPISIKHIAKQIIPPVFIRLFNRSSKYGWHGDYTSWQRAMEHCSGYNTDAIFEKVKDAAFKVHKGEALFERDSVLFYNTEYNWPLLSCLLLSASAENNALHIADFGGSLGSIYYQHKKLLSSLKELQWSVIEQPHFIEFGQQHLQSDELQFYTTIEECLKKQQPQTLLLSSVLQYLEKPFDTIADLLQYRFNYILIDRTAFIKGSTHRLTIQTVPPAIYNASYPAWFFNESMFLSSFLSAYELVCDFENTDFCNLSGSFFKGYFFKRTGI